MRTELQDFIREASGTCRVLIEESCKALGSNSGGEGAARAAAQL